MLFFPIFLDPQQLSPFLVPFLEIFQFDINDGYDIIVGMKKRQHIKDKNLLATLDEVKRMGILFFGPKLREIILYGSYARSSQDNESDLDIMFLFDGTKEEIVRYRDRIVDIMVEISLKYDVVLSITESTVRDFKHYIDYIPFYSNVYTEGVEIYAA